MSQRLTTASSVSVIIPCYRCAHTIAYVIDALLAQTLQPAEIIVVNDDSPDSLESALLPYRDRITYIRNERNRGLAASYNIGLRRASAAFVMTLHSDCLLDRDYIEKLLTHYHARTDLGCATGQYLFEDLAQLGFSDRMFLALNCIPVETDRSDISTQLVAFTEGKADLFRRETIASYGFFNENLKLTAEDQELSARLRADGYVLLQDAGCRFRVRFTGTSSTITKVLDKQRTYARGQAYIALTFPGNMLGPATPNRKRRKAHRLSQLLAAPAFLLSLLLAIIAPGWTLLPLGVILSQRYLHYFMIAHYLNTRDRACAAALGPIADLLYFAGGIEGVARTLLLRRA